jgi:hypothetical protein
MKLDVPFFTNQAHDCGPVCLQMALAYFGKQYPWEELRQQSNSYAGGHTLTIGLAKAAAKLGFHAEFYTTSLAFDPTHTHLPFYQQAGTAHMENQSALVAAAKEHGAELHEQHLQLKELLAKITPDCIAIVLIDWSKIQDRPSYQGHFLVLVGYDEEFIYFHQPGPKDPEPFFKLTHDIFDNARRAAGTDEDIVFIRKK